MLPECYNSLQKIHQPAEIDQVKQRQARLEQEEQGEEAKLQQGEEGAEPRLHQGEEPKPLQAKQEGTYNTCCWGTTIESLHSC
jgi:hypothetical protein